MSVDEPVEKIFQAAIQSEDGIVHTVAKPGRHHDVIALMDKQGYPRPIMGKQGFITTKGRFVDRRQAAAIALMTGQIEKLKYQPNQLFSEDLW